MKYKLIVYYVHNSIYFFLDLGRKPQYNFLMSNAKLLHIGSVVSHHTQGKDYNPVNKNQNAYWVNQKNDTPL